MPGPFNHATFDEGMKPARVRAGFVILTSEGLEGEKQMPWVNREMCTGCSVCVGECPAGAITTDGGIASIDDNTCIRCGVCHDVCPSDAVRHDGERIPEEVESNLAWVR